MRTPPVLRPAGFVVDEAAECPSGSDTVVVDRAGRSDAADALCVSAYAGSGAPETGCALVAVGGYGRRELAPYSDLDVVLVHEPGVDLGGAGDRIWYPIWDSGAKLDHSVRTEPDMIAQADADLRVAHRRGGHEVDPRLASGSSDRVLDHQPAADVITSVLSTPRSASLSVGNARCRGSPECRRGGHREVGGRPVRTWVVRWC